MFGKFFPCYNNGTIDVADMKYNACTVKVRVIS